jgi:predicted ATPase
MTTPLIRRLRLQNFLSFGPEGVSVDLLPLNVLIGPNASGKSNLLEALTIFRAAAGDLQSGLREGGGIAEYLWKPATAPAVLEMTVRYEEDDLWFPIRHRLELDSVANRVHVREEKIDIVTVEVEETIYEFDGARGSVLEGTTIDGPIRAVLQDVKSSQSILSQRRDPNRFAEVTFLGDQFTGILIFSEWNTGRHAASRIPQPTDLPSDFLLPDTSNLGLILHDLGQTSAKRDELIAYLRRFYAPARYISTKVQGGTIQLFIEEEGGRLIPATRLSDGTLHYLCLLAILLHPDPPPVIGIEEPELGLHPDIMPTIAELLKKASERTQLFVTTHSDALVSALSDTPESILVCESMPNGTTMKRLEPERLRTWLDEYTLGDVWRMGALGGNRW